MANVEAAMRQKSGANNNTRYFKYEGGRKLGIERSVFSMSPQAQQNIAVNGDNILASFCKN